MLKLPESHFLRSLPRQQVANLICLLDTFILLLVQSPQADKPQVVDRASLFVSSCSCVCMRSEIDAWDELCCQNGLSVSVHAVCESISSVTAASEGSWDAQRTMTRIQPMQRPARIAIAGASRSWSSASTQCRCSAEAGPAR